MRVPLRSRQLAVLLCLVCMAEIAVGVEFNEDVRQFTFAWPYEDQAGMRPRGGSTNGPAVSLDKKPGAAWKALQESGLSKLERDRRAILAMAGQYRTSFDFIETIGFDPDYKVTQPYQSWTTEYVYVITDQPDYISLQHIIVMFFDSEDGEVSAPSVVKHWRQDWRYEDRDLNQYAGDNRWQLHRLSRKEAKGTWSQAVFQVDDSPRYEASGKWRHEGGHSSWVGGKTMRPLPRREYSIRDDYHALLGTNRHTITPFGWVHEQDNLKLVLDKKGNKLTAGSYVAREAGLNRYERIVDHDFTAGSDYWMRTSPFWAEVRSAWENILKRRNSLVLRQDVDGKRMFEVMFEYAAGIESPQKYDSNAGKAFVNSTLAKYRQVSDL